MQWKLADEGNCAMAIWLGKQYLNQIDKQGNYLLIALNLQ
jgi:hypothetical protein